MSKSRSAHHTITGYHYQFDKSILDILRATPKQPITLEGIEDVDVGDECIQVKYHATQKYQPSTIRKPMMAFLTHYGETGGSKNYTLYVHFRDPAKFTEIDLAELKKILRSERSKLKLRDKDLSAFLKNSFKYVEADDIDSQREEVFAQLQKTLAASRADCEEHFYAAALQEVFRLSQQASIDDRKVTRSSFIKAINHKPRIFRRWLAEMSGQENYIKHIVRCLKAGGAMRSTRSRTIVLTRELIQDQEAAALARFCHWLADDHYPLGKVLHSAVPITVVLDQPLDRVRKVQQRLLEKGVSLNTGYEGIAFQPGFFNEPPLIIKMTSGAGQKATNYVSKASYRLAVISSATYKKHSSRIESPDSFIVAGQSGKTTPSPPSGAAFFEIAYVDSLGSLASILAK